MKVVSISNQRMINKKKDEGERHTHGRKRDRTCVHSKPVEKKHS